jgi:hypothetical protein
MLDSFRRRVSGTVSKIEKTRFSLISYGFGDFGE